MIASNATTVRTQTSGGTTETTSTSGRHQATVRRSLPSTAASRDRHRRVSHGAVRDDDDAAGGILPSYYRQNYSPLRRTLSNGDGAAAENSSQQRDLHSAPMFSRRLILGTLAL